MDLQIAELPFDTMGLHGLSDKLLLSHHQNNYAGAAKRLNAIRRQLSDLDFGQAPGFQLNGLKREELIASNNGYTMNGYGEIFARNVGADSPLQLPRGLNAQWNKGGILYALPLR